MSTTTSNSKGYVWLGIGMLIIVVVYATVSSSATSKPTIEDYSHPVLRRIRENFARIDPRYGNVPLKLSHRGAYTEEKEYIAMCVRDPDTGKDYEFNEIMYVSLHELAHYISKGYGHGREFISNFNYLLGRARTLGIYRDITPPETYCGA